AELPQKAAQQRLYSYLGETLLAFCAKKPLLLILDDLQWADELSLGFLRVFLRIEPLARWLLVVGTYRSEELRAEELEALRRAPLVEELSLARLGEDAVGRIVGDMLAIPPPRILSRYLTTHSEGNPFFIAEYLRAAVEE